MAANYWESTQRRYWQFTKDQLSSMRKTLSQEDDNQTLIQMFALAPQRHLNVFFNQQINRLGKRLVVRQQAMATAQMYIKRFYIKVEIRRTNPYLVIATAVYLACKMEECPQHIRLLVTEARSLWPEYVGLDMSKVGECEFFMISEMNSQLIVHQPYRTLTALQADFALSPDDVALAWSVINDHYMTDLPLLYPPHVVAVTAILLALVLRPNASSSSGSGSQGGGSSQGSTNAAGNGNGTGSATGGHVGMAAATAALAQAQAALTGGGNGNGGNGGGGSSNNKVPDSSRASKFGRFSAWLAESNIDIEAMVDCTQELIAFYESHEQYSDKLTREQIGRFVRARGLDK